MPLSRSEDSAVSADYLYISRDDATRYALSNDIALQVAKNKAGRLLSLGVGRGVAHVVGRPKKRSASLVNDAIPHRAFDFITEQRAHRKHRSW